MENRRIIRTIACRAGAPLPLKTLMALTGQKMVLPFYHAVSDHPLPHLVHLLSTRNALTFRRDLEWFLRHYAPVDISQLEALATGEQALKRPCFHLSFDDGLKEAATVIAPLLLEMGIPATFFINTAFIGNKDLFYRFKASLLTGQAEQAGDSARRKASQLLAAAGITAPTLKDQLLAVEYPQKELLDEVAPLLEMDFREYLKNHEVYLDEEDIGTLMRQGFSIGGHSHDHPEFRRVTPEEQLHQARESTRLLKERFGGSPALFSFPFSDEEVPASFFRQVHPPAGDIALTFGISGLKKEVFRRHLHRIPMEQGNFTASSLLHGEYLYYLMKAPFHKNRINRP